MAYFIVAIRDGRGAQWEMHFGDYDRDTAKAELEDILESYDRCNTKLLRLPTDSWESIDSAIAELNK